MLATPTMGPPPKVGLVDEPLMDVNGLELVVDVPEDDDEPEEVELGVELLVVVVAVAVPEPAEVVVVVAASELAAAVVPPVFAVEAEPETLPNVAEAAPPAAACAAAASAAALGELFADDVAADPVA